MGACLTGQVGPVRQVVTLAWPEMLDWLDVGKLGLRPTGDPIVPLVFVDLDASPARPGSGQLAAVARAVTESHRVMVGVADGEVSAELAPLVNAFACTLVRGAARAAPAGLALLRVQDPPQRLPPDQLAGFGAGQIFPDQDPVRRLRAAQLGPDVGADCLRFDMVSGLWHHRRL